MATIHRVAISYIFYSRANLFHRYSRTACRNHQHAATASYRFIVQVYTNHGIGTHSTGMFLHLAQGYIFSFAQHFFIRATSPTHHVADAGKEIAEYIGTDNRFTGNDAIIAGDTSTLNSRGCCY